MKELWPKVRTETCCKCSASFMTEEVNAYTAVCAKQDGWDFGQDVDGQDVVYCPEHAMPRVEWSRDTVFVRADPELLPVEKNKALAQYAVRSTNSGYEVRLLAPGFDLLVCDRPPIWSGPGNATFFCYFEPEDYAKRLGQAALRCYLETKDKWRTAKVESRMRRLEELNARLWRTIADNCWRSGGRYDTPVG